MKRKREKYYTIENLTEEQLDVIKEALNLYARIIVGQFEVIGELFVFRGITSKKETRFDPQALSESLRCVKKIVYPELNESASYGILCKEIDDSARIGVDIHDVIRNRLLWDRANDMRIIYAPYGVGYDEPFHCCKRVDLPLIKEQPGKKRNRK